MSKRKNTVPQKAQSKKQWLKDMLGFRSIFVAVIISVVLYQVVDKNNGYNWAWNSLLKGNWELIRKYPNTTLEERYQMKLGYDFAFLNYIKKNTPDTAIILFPKRELITEKVENTQLGSAIGNKMWVTHFIYPRRVIYKEEDTVNPLYKNVTHIAICAGHGYDELEYNVEQRTYFGVFPKKVLPKKQ
jgi:hypothetical protein